jgi:hemoglobin-like flavoprotein
LLPKKFVLQVQDGDGMRPMTQEEFEEELLKLHPEIAKIFEDENEIKSIQVPPIDESMPIYHHWENVSQRLMTALSRVENVHHFNQPVDPNVCTDYNNIIKNPMDFGLIKSKLKTH